MYVHMHLVGLQNFIIPEYLLFLVLGCNMGLTMGDFWSHHTCICRLQVWCCLKPVVLARPVVYIH